MLNKLVVFLLAFFTVLATATGNPPATTTITVTQPAPTGTTVSQCNTGNISCCNSVQSANSNVVSSLLGLLGIVLGDVTGLVGLGCTPLSIIGIGSGVSCTQQPVCCQNVQFNGLINIGCTAISL